MELGLDLRCYMEEVTRDFDLLEVWDADHRTDSGTVVRVSVAQ